MDKRIYLLHKISSLIDICKDLKKNEVLSFVKNLDDISQLLFKKKNLL